MRDKMLGCMVWGLEGVVFDIAAIPSSDVFYVGSLTSMLYHFIDCVLAYAIFGQCPLGCVRILATTFGTRIIITALVTWVH